MHVEFAHQAADWGEWAFGDLAAAVCRAVEVVGPNADVVQVAVRHTSDGIASVALGVGDVEEVGRLKAEATSGEYDLIFLNEPLPWAWEAEVNGVRLLVAVPRGDRR